jgi:hypothetical protein
MRCEASRGLALLAGVGGTLLLSIPAHGEGIAPTSMDGPALVAYGDCWARRADEGLAAALTRCARAGIDVAELQVRSYGDRGLQACTDSRTCAPLDAAMAADPAPRLLLRTPVAYLDDVRAVVMRSHTAARTLVAPQVDRPEGAATRVLAPGVIYRREHRVEPRVMMIHIVEVDLAQAGLDFVVTPGRPDAGLEFVAEKTTAFAQRMHTLVAINATYFRPFEGGRLLARAYVPALGQAVEVDGVSIADGRVDSSWTNPDPRSDGAFCVTPKAVSIARAPCPSGTTEAVGGGPVLLEAGKRRPLAGEAIAAARVGRDGTGSIPIDELPAYYHEAQPRTAVGLDNAGSRMWFVVVDGRQDGYSEGITLPELTALFVDLGAQSAINLDGGGSSTLVLASGEGEQQLANSPIHTGIPGRERPVGNHLGLRVPAGAATSIGGRP